MIRDLEAVCGRAMPTQTEPFTSLDQEPDVLLDEAEQDELIAVLGKQSLKNARFAERAIVPLGGLLSAICLYLALQSHLDPWSVRHSAELSGVVDPGWLVAGQAGIAAAVAISSAAVAACCRANAALERRLLIPAMGLSLSALLFWIIVVGKLIAAGEVRGKGPAPAGFCLRLGSRHSHGTF